MNRRLSIDGPTEASLSPLELLAMDTVPKYQPDTSFFGTPRSRQLTGQSPLEQLAGALAGEQGDSWSHGHPVVRTRQQRMPGQELPKAPRRDYQGLPGVATGTAALGLVEQRNNQPFFHVPVFTTPIPSNGKFITANPDPLRGFAASLRNITASIGRQLPRLPTPSQGLSRLKEAMARATTHGRDIPIKPAGRPLHREGGGQRGRQLDTFSRYTKMGNFRARAAVGSGAPSPLLLYMLAALVLAGR
jgi:hypothetical protein